MNYSRPIIRNSGLVAHELISTKYACHKLVSRSITTKVYSKCSAFYPFNQYQALQPQKTVPKFFDTQKARFHVSTGNYKDDLYSTLGVSKNASISDIKKSYYQLAKKYHPDVNKEPGSKEKFHKIQEAYDTLSDETKRSNYDQFGTADPSGSGGFGGQGFPGFGGMGGMNGAPSMDDIFSQIFGAGAGRSSSSQGPMNRGSFRSTGEDIEYSVRISFEDAVAGKTVTVSTQPVLECNTCDGLGVKKGAKASTCSTCKGSGQQTFSMGGFHVRQQCSSCGGSGSAVKDKDLCGTCKGRGVIQSREQVSVDIPAGCDDGMVLELRNKGDAPIGGKGPRGSLYVQVRVSPSKIFTRKGADVFYTAKVPLSKVLVGGEMTFPTISGNVDVKIKQGSQPGDELRLRGKGMKKVKGMGNGDFYIKLNIEIPKNLTKKQQEYAKLLADELEGKSSNGL
ncbi:DnaJ-like protein [Smittium culicis]|uniref:DnaJ homolog 1, mitochondrial n=1 Tax=Smittium culicis TaxID=133412 RepID=A0A1R1WXE2_9FUNG|nr:DnaJ-like protein [Smittium culicis]